MININMHDLLRLSSIAMQWAMQERDKGEDPSSDLMKQNEAKRYIKARGFKPVVLSKWAELGWLHPVKMSEAQNSPRLYSKAEILKLLYSLKMKAACDESKDNMSI